MYPSGIIQFPLDSKSTILFQSKKMKSIIHKPETLKRRTSTVASVQVAVRHFSNKYTKKENSFFQQLSETSNFVVIRRTFS
jgi:hypothetical protein